MTVTDLIKLLQAHADHGGGDDIVTVFDPDLCEPYPAQSLVRTPFKAEVELTSEAM